MRPIAASPSLQPPPATSPGLAFVGLLLLALPWSLAATCPFIYMDDPQYVTRNPHVLAGLSLEGVRWAFSNVDLYLYQPLTWLSLMLDSSLFGTGPAGYHITNIVLHVANTLLLFQLLRTATGSMGRSWLVAAVFCIHPLRVESVAWVTERKDVLFAFFGILALLAYVRYARSMRLGWLALSCGLAAASLLSKAMLVLFPALLLMMDFWPLGRVSARNWRRIVLEKIPFALISAAAIVVTAVALRSTHADVSAAIPLGQRVSNALLACTLYLRDTFYFGGLSVFYPYHDVGTDQAVTAAAILLMITAAALWVAIKRPLHGRPVLIGWIWFLVTFAPVLGVQAGAQSRADRFTYFPSIGLLIALVWCWPAPWFAEPARAKMRNYAVGAVLMALVCFTALQLLLWRNPLSLYLAGIDRTRDNWYLMARAADVYRDAGMPAESEDYYRRALKLHAGHGETHYNYGGLLMKQKRVAEGVEQFRLACKFSPDEKDFQAALDRALRELRPEAQIAHGPDDAIRIPLFSYDHPRGCPIMP